ncbi:hypothetical protein [Streptomyces sp. NPDC059814]|uniref:hypothetical protein n=1 Tax=unclassified Streptomyces TaxID=2593676 RepID=UPI00364CC7C4
MTASDTGTGGSPASEFAGGIVDFVRTSRSREYPDGVYVGLMGFPDFLPYAARTAGRPARVAPRRLEN